MSVPNENADDVSYLFSSCVQKKTTRKPRSGLAFRTKSVFSRDYLVFFVLKNNYSHKIDLGLPSLMVHCDL